MKTVAVFLVVALAVAYGQFFCPNSENDPLNCVETMATTATCMQSNKDKSYSYACGYCGKKKESCFGNKVPVRDYNCKSRNIVNPCGGPAL
uniref:Superfamily Pmag-02 n=1 Tax=Conus magus TaxID=6492 RepID=A0A5P8I0Z0_CONMA|nr:superfamily Pmag-02 [Conus magus]